MKKQYELIALYGRPGNYTAVLYDRLGQYYKELYFIWYNKKEIFYKLRNEYDCMVSREAAKK